MKTIVFLFVTVLLRLVSFGQNDSSRLNFKKNYVDYLGEDTIQAFFWNGTIARCPIPSPLFNSLDSVESEVIVVIMYMPMRYEENGELNNKKVKETTKTTEKENTKEVDSEDDSKDDSDKSKKSGEGSDDADDKILGMPKMVAIGLGVALVAVGGFVAYKYFKGKK
jgi:hypothetical protein